MSTKFTSSLKYRVQQGYFGTAKNLRDDTHNGPEFVGTPEYMSPEAINSKAAGPEADLWALGCILYQMLCGQNAFVGGSQ